MHRILRRVLPRPTLVVFSGVVLAAHAFSAVTVDPAHVAEAHSALVAQRTAFGLKDADGFRPRASHVNAQGTSIVRFVQEHQGVRVWGAEAIAHVHPNGGVKTVTSGIATQVTVSGTPRLTADQAIHIALRDLAPKGSLGTTPRAEQIVFPTRFTGGLVTRWDPAHRRNRVDPAMSVIARPPAAPYVWAWEVHTVLLNRLDGHVERTFIVDASTGAILRKGSDLRTAATVGTGHGFYNPDVKLGTTRDRDGGFSMVDSTRGALPNVFLSGDAITFYTYVGPATGLITLYEDHLNGGFAVYEGNKVDTWGDGKAFVGSFIGDPANLDYSYAETTVNGQTPAVDAQYGVGTTWDYYKNVFDRNGIDDLGTSTFSYTHELDPLSGGPLDNASWSDELFGMFYGDGSWPFNPLGFQEVASMDVTGHEMTHGVTAATAGLIYDGESGGLNEATSDCMGEMVEAYSQRDAGTDSIVPEGNDWLVGAGPGRGTPLRYFDKPSKDGESEDQWYDGIALREVHYSSGAMNRAYYFLSHGASASSADDGYSPYLPGGMTGIGNNRSAHILYKALSEYYTPSTGFADARAAFIQAAQDLYGQTEVTAVMSAFAAINVGEAPGASPRTLVTLPAVHATGYLSVLDDVFEGFDRAPIFPIGTTVTLTANVANNSNTDVTWLLQGRPSFKTCSGTINPDGIWTTSNSDWAARDDNCWITAVSKADPLAFAVGNAFLVNLDADDDLEQDAIDLGSMAMSWGLSTAISPSNSPLEFGFVSDFDAAVAVEAIRNAFPAR
jgi:Zn-dependent metalloprotease